MKIGGSQCIIRRMRAIGLAVVLAGCAATPRTPSTLPVASPRPQVLASIEASRDLDGTVVGPSPVPTILIMFASWCDHCRDELQILETMQGARVRILGLNYKGHEDYAARGSSEAVRAFVRDHAAWLRVVPIDDDLFSALGRPPLIPTLYLYDRHGALAATFDPRSPAFADSLHPRPRSPAFADSLHPGPRSRPRPTRAELEALLAKLDH